MKQIILSVSGAVVMSILACPIASATITDFTNWTQVQDPAHPSFTGSAIATSATLVASNGLVPMATDIGYQSVNGATVGSSTSGYAFSAASSFSIAIDYSLSFSSGPVGFLSIGFGIGEDSDGMNSAGAVMATQNGAAFGTFGGGARINDVDQAPYISALPASLAGSLFVAYNAANGDITVGASQTPGAASPTVSGTFSGIQNAWTGSDLLVSFFMRSGPIAAWSAGNGQVVFNNVRLIEGEALAVPAPAALALLALAGACRRRPARC